MKDSVFLDTNVIVYLYTEDDPEKQRLAAESIVGASNAGWLHYVIHGRPGEWSDH
ncbi:MAG: hypothetical protein LBQ97_04495 [Fusobacteriaceae bacterium]|nr:hypothetical protein [Fusobacteriaceae bacterium]